MRAAKIGMYGSNSHRIWWAPMRPTAGKNFGPHPPDIGQCQERCARCDEQRRAHTARSESRDL